MLPRRRKALIHSHNRRMHRSRTYVSWVCMVRRCTNPHHQTYAYYGGRGIAVCKRWRKFANFLKDMGTRPPGETLDRKNTNGNYNKRNCRWATPKEQRANRRSK